MPPKDRFKAVRERDPFRWTQATHAIRFKYLRNGMVLNPTPDQVAAYLDPTQRQDWRVAPPKGKLPRVDPSWLPVPHMFDSSNAPRPYALLGGQNPRLPADRRATATQAFNEVTRSLAEIVSWPGTTTAVVLVSVYNPRPCPRALMFDSTLCRGFSTSRRWAGEAMASRRCTNTRAAMAASGQPSRRSSTPGPWRQSARW